MPQDTLPNYHFLLIAPNLGSEWLYEAGRRYWLRFFPTVISDFAILRFIPENFTIAVTVIARRDRVAQLGVELAQVSPKAVFDPVVHDFYEDTQAELERRADSNQPFGVPLSPTATPTSAATSEQLQPTAGPISTQGPSATPTEQGFLQPLPTQTQTAEPGTENTEEATENAGPQAIYPTPGPITSPDE